MTGINSLTASARLHYKTMFKRALVAVKGGWTQQVNARTAEGQVVSALDAKARKYCTIGAIYASFAEQGKSSLSKAELPEKALMYEIVTNRPELEHEYVSAWNDHPNRKKKDVVQLFKNIIKDLE